VFGYYVICSLLRLAICLSNLYTRCEARPYSPLRERRKSLKFINPYREVRFVSVEALSLSKPNLRVGLYELNGVA